MSEFNKIYLKEEITEMNSMKLFIKEKIKFQEIIIEEINKEKFYLETKEYLSLEDIIKNLNDKEKNSIIEKYENQNHIYIIRKYDIRNIKLFKKKFH